MLGTNGTFRGADNFRIRGTTADKGADAKGMALTQGKCFTTDAIYVMMTTFGSSERSIPFPRTTGVEIDGRFYPSYLCLYYAAADPAGIPAIHLTNKCCRVDVRVRRKIDRFRNTGKNGVKESRKDNDRVGVFGAIEHRRSRTLAEKHAIPLGAQIWSANAVWGYRHTGLVSQILIKKRGLGKHCRLLQHAYVYTQLTIGQIGYVECWGATSHPPRNASTVEVRRGCPVGVNRKGGESCHTSNFGFRTPRHHAPEGARGTSVTRFDHSKPA